MKKIQEQDKTFQELVDWARRYLLVEIGKGNYQDATWLIANEFFVNGCTYGINKEKENQKNKNKEKIK